MILILSRRFYHHVGSVNNQSKFPKKNWDVIYHVMYRIFKYLIFQILLAVWHQGGRNSALT